MQIGRNIYYELSTGNVIVDTGERSGDVVATTEAQDFQLYAALQPYQQSAVGVLQLDYGEDDNYFQQGYSYSVDITQNPPVINWGSVPTASLAQVQAAQKQIIEQGYEATLAAGFQSSANGAATTYTYRPVPDQLNYNKIATNILLGKQAYPFTLTDAGGTSQSFTTQAEFEQLATDAGAFDWAQSNQLMTMNQQIDAATTVDAVNAIQWSAGTYTHS